MNTIVKLKLTAAVMSALILAACGGGGGSDSGGDSGNGGNSGGNSASAVNGGNSTGSGSSGVQGSYAVTPSVSGSGGTISPSVTTPVLPGQTTSFTLTPNSGYTVSAVNGTCGGTLNGTTYTTNAITANCTVVVTFTANGSNGAITSLYETLPSPQNTGTGTAGYMASILALLNQEGAKGYRYLGNTLFTSDSVNASMVFVNDGTAPSYTYDLTGPDPSDAPSLLNQANAEGAKGYRYEGRLLASISPTYTYYSFYRKDGGSSAAYAYVLDPETGSTADWLTQANGRGQSGYYWLAWFYGYGYGNLYIKNNASNAIYVYDTPAAPAALTDLLTQLNSKGANGYRAIGGSNVYIGAGTVWLYVKDLTQTATFTYQSGPSVATGTADAFISQANSNGAQGYAYFGDVATSPAGNSSTYVKAGNCNGFLCTSLNPPMFQN